MKKNKSNKKKINATNESEILIYVTCRCKKQSNKVWSDLFNELFLIYSFIKRFILAASVLRTLHVYLHSNLHTCYFLWTGSAHVCAVRICDAFVSGEGGVDLCFSGVWKWACGPPTGGAGRSRATLGADTAADFLHRVMTTWRCLSELGIILVRCKILTFYDQRKRTPNLYEFFFLLSWPFGVYSFIFSATSSPEGWASGVSCAFNTPLSPGVNTARRGWGRPHNRFCFTVFHRPAAPPRVCTYINFVFAVSHSDVVEQRGFIQVHQRAWETQAGQESSREVVISQTSSMFTCKVMSQQHVTNQKQA